MGVSRRSYAAQRGVPEAAVRKAIATGRITTLPDGTIDPARADSEWGAQTDPAKQRGQHARQMGAETAAGTARAAASKPVPQAAIRAVADTLRDAGTDPRLQAPWHHHALRCAGRQVKSGHRGMHAAQPRTGVPELPPPYRPGGEETPRHPYRARQLSDPQDARGACLAGETSALQAAFHAHQRVLVD